ncbi:hypothetical protein [Leuconostoc falkenbergense]|uniref:hypothetical protein n=1 Tax=Leuconostoc falkenbergense TaxID=2766470 RepID=UPI001FC8E319|nr:hypothetical protein [Leuconostoc falkenbergense]
MSKYQKKPVTIEAWKSYDFKLDDNLPLWVIDAFNMRRVGNACKKGFDYCVITLEGKMYFNNGDYLVKGVRGELYSCKSDIFEETYTMVD